MNPGKIRISINVRDIMTAKTKGTISAGVVGSCTKSPVLPAHGQVQRITQRCSEKEQEQQNRKRSIERNLGETHSPSEKEHTNNVEDNEHQKVRIVLHYQPMSCFT